MLIVIAIVVVVVVAVVLLLTSNDRDNAPLITNLEDLRSLRFAIGPKLNLGPAPAPPSPTYRRTAGRQNPCLCPERCHVWPGGVGAGVCERLVSHAYDAPAFSWLPLRPQW